MNVHFTQRELDAILRTDLCAFVEAIYPIVSTGDPLVPNWHIEAIAYALSRVASGEIRRLMILMRLASECIQGRRVAVLPSWANGRSA